MRAEFGAGVFFFFICRGDGLAHESSLDEMFGVDYTLSSSTDRPNRPKPPNILRGGLRSRRSSSLSESQPSHLQSQPLRVATLPRVRGAISRGHRSRTQNLFGIFLLLIRIITQLGDPFRLLLRLLLSLLEVKDLSAGDLLRA